MSRLFPAAGLVLLLVLLAANVYRAATQSFTTDEALTANLYVETPFRDLLTAFDACHHVLHTLLMRLSASLLGVSELTLRIPSLLGGASYLAAALLLARRLLGRGPLFLVAFASLSLDPFLLDFLSAARGYGMAVGLFLWALFFLDRYFEAASPRLLTAGAVSLALSVAANLVLAVPGVALVAAAAVLLIRRGEASRLADHLILPGIAAAFVILVIPLAHATPGHFYAGGASLRTAADGLVVASLYHSTPDQTDAGARFPQFRRMLRIAALPLVSLACLAVAAALGWIGWRLVRGRLPALRPAERFLWLAGGSLAGAIALAAALHRAFGTPYPDMRTGLYFLALFPLASFALAASAPWPRMRGASLAFLALFFGLCVAQFALQWNTRFYFEWPYDAGMKTALEHLRRAAAESPAPLRVGATPYLEPTVNFYATRLGIPMNRIGREGPVEGRDYYLLAGDDCVLARRLALRPVFTDAFGKLVLAERPR